MSDGHQQTERKADNVIWTEEQLKQRAAVDSDIWTEAQLKQRAAMAGMAGMKAAQQPDQCCQVSGSTTANVFSRRSLREEAERQVSQHLEQADKKARAATFFREHPEFDEFIQLIRGGVIGI
jgi:hypothetical protein